MGPFEVIEKTSESREEDKLTDGRMEKKKRGAG